MIKPEYNELLEKYHSKETQHSDRATLFSHLKGTHDLLEEWNNDDYLCVAGLFHSIYGTEQFKHQSVSLKDRAEIIETIGEQAENIAYLFGVMSRKSLFENVGKSQFYLLNIYNKEQININEKELSDLLELETANWFEQVACYISNVPAAAWLKDEKVKPKALIKEKLEKINLIKQHISSFAYQKCFNLIQETQVVISGLEQAG